ncbi:hypothetical protein K3495_g472 [Podosphaera aphanis]|nr:hypothetical protein K3495_g472 [Podosphaera aphanis]
MSIIQIENLVSYQLRKNYLETTFDGIGERLITLNDGFLSTTGLGWRQIAANRKQTYSPPIPTAIASEYFQAPPRSETLQPNSVDEYSGIGLGATNTGDVARPGIMLKKRRRREQMEEEDSSELSDESDDEFDQRNVQQITFSKMPIRNRSGSSPIRGSNLRQSSTLNSPPNNPSDLLRRGSQSAIGITQVRVRRDTVTSGEISFDDFDAPAFQRQREVARNSVRESKILLKESSNPTVSLGTQSSEPLKEEEEEEEEDEDDDDDDGDEDDDEDEDEDEDEEDSDESGLDSDFVGSLDSASIIHEMNRHKSPNNIVGPLPREYQRSPTKKSKPAPAVLTALPPARPISFIQPKSLLSAAIKAKRTKAAMPFESFASLSGQAESNPLNLRIWALFATSTTRPFEVLIRRSVHENEAVDRQVTVADLIGLSLWRYAEEKLEPSIPEEKLNINKWTLRMVEDEEVDYDFPALDRTKPVVAFSTANNRAVRSRSGAKPYDEFALVEATEEQFADNQLVTPQFKQEILSQAEDSVLNPSNSAALQLTPSLISIPRSYPRQNPVLNPTFGLRANGVPADTPAVGDAVVSSFSRQGAQKLLRIHIHSTDAAPGQITTIHVTTNTYLVDVLDMICKKRQLDKAAHVLKLTGSGTVVLLDRTVESIGNRLDLDLFRRRFATDGPLTMTGSPSSYSPRVSLTVDRPESRKVKKSHMMSTHPLAQHSMKQDEVGSANYRKYTVWRKQPMRFVGMNERILAIDGEYLHIMPASAGKTLFEGQGKTTTVHFSNIVGCKITRRHPTNFKIVIFKTTETKRYDFEAKRADEAAEIVFEIKKGISPYHNV